MMSNMLISSVGYGVLTWKNGNRYEGDWKHGKQCGHGTLLGKDGNKMRVIYAGNWKNGFKNVRKCATHQHDVAIPHYG